MDPNTLEQLIRRIEWLEARVSDNESNIAYLREFSFPQPNWDERWDEDLNHLLVKEENNNATKIESRSASIRISKTDP